MERYKRKFEEGRNFPIVSDSFRVDKVLDSENELQAFGHITMQKPNRMPTAWTETVPVKELHDLYDRLEEICEKEIKKFRSKYK